MWAGEMGVKDAIVVFERFGARLSGNCPVELRRAWIRLAWQYHAGSSANGAGQRAMAEINAAHDVLRHALDPVRGSRISARDPRRQGICIWAWAGHPGGAAPLPNDRIEQADDRDRNFVKRRIWLLSDGSQEEWTIWPFDGRRFMEPLTVYGCRQVFDEMARAALRFARIGFRRPRAVFLQRRGEAWADLLLVHSDGVPRAAIPFRHQGGSNPARDHIFVANLPARLDRIRLGIEA
ncbi:MAG: hypothetical protein IRY87_27715 [Acetobacteraceae bacterium]|nr:hypothetical protein [Acetobacteraceae bacterium]